MNVGIIGCGLIGKKRALNLGDDKLVFVCDTVEEKAKALAGEFGAKWTADYRELVSSPDIDIVIVSTINKYLAPVSIAALKKKKHVLVEKPVATGMKEMNALVAAAKKSGTIVKAGFNHRFHPAILKAFEIYKSGAPGEVMYIRARYGHGGRVGYEDEWRAKQELSGGGELLDQGVHLIDLSRKFMGDFEDISGACKTCFWKMDVEDNCFMTLTTKDNRVAFLHTSWTEWKNMFSFEISCKNAKLQIDGLGGSYGVEKLTHYKMKKEMGVPEIETFEFPGEDLSWKREWEDFRKAIDTGSVPDGSLPDAREALKIVFSIYGKQSKKSLT